MSKAWDAIIIGGGAAGLFCAGIAGQLGKKILVLDHAPVLGEKIRISEVGAVISPTYIARLRIFFLSIPTLQKVLWPDILLLSSSNLCALIELVFMRSIKVNCFAMIRQSKLLRCCL